jgi:hypothetical protein
LHAAAVAVAQPHLVLVGLQLLAAVLAAETIRLVLLGLLTQAAVAVLAKMQTAATAALVSSS